MSACSLTAAPAACKPPDAPAHASPQLLKGCTTRAKLDWRPDMHAWPVFLNRHGIGRTAYNLHRPNLGAEPGCPLQQHSPKFKSNSGWVLRRTLTTQMSGYRQ